jgi:tRNA U38,U39,U40 pseudouridine synthase TruA
MRIALGLEYDGTMFCGWQSQAGGGSVQDALESAVSAIADAPLRVVCAGAPMPVCMRLSKWCISIRQPSGR